jgi:voltage-gated potassium channel Kch
MMERMKPSVVERLRNSFSFIVRVLRVSKLGYIALVAGSLVLVAATGFWRLERGANEGIVAFGDALWWAVETTTTVGYGDIAPQTAAGRTLASLLMVCGIGLVASMVSSLSTAVARVGRERDKAPILALVAELEALVEARERGQLTDAEYQRRRQNLLEITRIKVEG